jgi:hypothetical protein
MVELAKHWEIRTNKYEGKCFVCKRTVIAKKGLAVPTVNKGILYLACHVTCHKKLLEESAQ